MRKRLKTLSPTELDQAKGGFAVTAAVIGAGLAAVTVAGAAAWLARKTQKATDWQP